MKPGDFVPLAWPAVIVVIVFSFYGPLYNSIDALSERLTGLSHLKIGDLEIAIDPAALPRPDKAVAAAIRSMDREGLLLLLELEGTEPNKEGGDYCFSDLETNPRMLKFRKLESAGLVAITAQMETVDWCPNPHSVAMTREGQDVRAFAVNLLAAQLTGQ